MQCFPHTLNYNVHLLLLKLSFKWLKKTIDHTHCYNFKFIFLHILVLKRWTLSSHWLHTCFQLQVQLVSVSTEGPVELNLYLEGLASAKDQLIPVIQVSVMLLSVLTCLGTQ